MDPLIWGLSPRVRGNPAHPPAWTMLTGSIPARAGEPSWYSPTSYRKRVYPRACGGTASLYHDIQRPTGLSPRVRGNRPSLTARVLRRGSIPARAGEPLCQGTGIAIREVYPRACGGTTATSRARRSRRGLSPRVRGNRRSATAISAKTGSIPARAGEPDSGLFLGLFLGVYPRACGGTS